LNKKGLECDAVFFTEKLTALLRKDKQVTGLAGSCCWLTGEPMNALPLYTRCQAANRVLSRMRNIFE
jgi:hypothetical protein